MVTLVATMSKLWIRVALGLGGLALFLGWRSVSSPRVRVTCSAEEMSVGCVVAHESGFSAANACWDVVLTCSNGVRHAAHACQAVSPGQTSKRLLSFGDFSPELSGCQSFSGSGVENLSVASL